MIDKIKELTKDTAIYGLSTIVGRFLNFLLVPFYTNFFSPYDVGVYSNIYAYLAFLNILFIYGMDAAYMKYSSISPEDDKKKTFSTALIFVFISTVLFSIFLWIVYRPFSGLMEIPSEFGYLYNYMIFILLLDTIAVVPFASLRLKRKSMKFSLIKLGNIILNLSLNFILVLKFKMGIEAILIANLAASALSLLLLMPEILANFVMKIDNHYLRLMLKFAIPYLPASLAATIVQVIDRPVVLALTNQETLGIYQANYKLGIFMMLIVQMFQFAWQPFFLNNSKEKNAKEIFSKVLTLFIIAASFVWIIVSLFVDDFARIEFAAGKSIIGKEFLSGIIIVPVILLAYMFNGIYYNFQAGIYIEEKTKYFPYVTGAGAVVNVVVNILLIPVLGIMGAALATLASYMIMAGGLFYFSQKFYKIKYEYDKIIKVLVLVFSVCAVYYLIHFQIGLNILYKIILLLVFITSLFVLRVIDKSELSKVAALLLKRN